MSAALVDTNLLIYASFPALPEHERARSWLELQLARSDGSLVLCWPVVYAFVRLISSRRVFREDALDVRRAWEAAAAYRTHPGMRMVVAGAGHAAIAAEISSTPGLGSDDVPDIELAALAIEHGLALASHDHGFRRFAALRFLDPLAIDG